MTSRRTRSLRRQRFNLLQPKRLHEITCKKSARRLDALKKGLAVSRTCSSEHQAKPAVGKMV